MGRLICGSVTVIVAGLLSTQVGAAQTEPVTRVIRLDRNGRPPVAEAEDTNRVLAREGDQLRVEFYPARVFDLGGIDVPSADRAKAKLGNALEAFFVYPQDPYVLFESPKLLIPGQNPGRFNVYLAAPGGQYRLRIAPLTQAELDAAIPKDTPEAWKSFLDQRRAACYLAGDSHLRGAGGFVDNSDVNQPENLLTNQHLRLLSFRDITLTKAQGNPYAVIELVKFGEFVDVAGVKGKCKTLKDGAKDLDIEKTPPDQVGSTTAMTIVKVSPDVKEAVLRYGFDATPVRAAMPLVDSAAGVYAATTSELSAGNPQYQVCHTITEESPLRSLVGPGAERCVPASPARLRVRSALPSSFRLQPGVVVTNRLRDVRLSIHGVILIDREEYFGGKGHHYLYGIVGGLLNPSFGLQVGGDNAVIVLMGLHTRFSDEAGMQFGVRFGDKANASQFRFERNWYVGFSMDPLLFSKVKGYK